MITRSKAPLRISFCGGGTDVSPYPEERGGCVLSTTIDKYAYVTLDIRSDTNISVHSLDYNVIAKYNLNGNLAYDGKLDLVKAATKVMEIEKGANLFLHTDAPPGSGLGSSSTLTVALVGVLKSLKQLNLTEYEIAELAYHIEREELKIKGGRQDQYSATFGGFNFIEFNKDTTIVNPLRIKPEIVNELEYRLMLCYVGRQRLSAGIIDDQINGYMQKKDGVVEALDETKELTIRMKQTLLLGHLNELGDLLHEVWQQKKKFSTRITDPYIDELYEVGKHNGALGGKLLGAGGGGYLLFFCEFDKWHKVAEKLELSGGKVVKFSFDFNGLQTWEVNGT